MEGFKKKEILYACLLVFFFVFFGVSEALAASLYFSPSSGSHNVGQSFSVGIYVSSTGQAMNAASGNISFPQDKLQVVSLSKSGSIFNLWVQEPTFSNVTGTVTFEGIVLNPGFQGSAGKIITVNLKGKSAGSASLTFSSGSVLANDGKGTNILASLGSGTYTIQTTGIVLPPEEEIIPTPTLGVPSAPIISSPTHPDSEKWYSNNNPEFTWQLPSDVIAVSYGIDQNSSTNPEFTADSLIENVSFSNLEDGIWYFHINLKNQYGWGALTHRQVLIDTEAPQSFQVVIDDEGDPTNPTPKFLFETNDLTSGIEYYEVILNEEPYATVLPQDIKDKPYKPLPLLPGRYSSTIKALDKAGNHSLASTSFDILPIGDIEITKIPERIRIGDVLRIEGKTLPELLVKIYIQREGEEPIIAETTSDSTGNFVLQYDKTLAQGDYFAWAQGEDERRALTNPSKKQSLKVGLPPFLQFGKIAIDYLSIMITLIVLIIGAIAIIAYTWYRISLWRKRLRKETKEVTRTVYNAFKNLRKELQNQIKYLDGKPGLTEEEKKVRDDLKKALDVSEEFIGKEIKDIEKELK